MLTGIDHDEAVQTIKKINATWKRIGTYEKMRNMSRSGKERTQYQDRIFDLEEHIRTMRRDLPLCRVCGEPTDENDQIALCTGCADKEAGNR